MREIVAADYPMTGRRVTREEAIEALPRQPVQGRARARDPRRRADHALHDRRVHRPVPRRPRATRPARSARSSSSRSPARTGAATSRTPMLQRIYGTAFATQQELDDYLAFLEEAAKRDHRKLGAELDLYHVDELAGGGLVFWHPKGALMRGIVEEFIRDGLRERGYLPVVTPHVVHENLYATSGHLENFADGDVRADRGRGPALPAQADELPRPHPDLQERARARTATCRCATASSAPSTASSAAARCTASRACAASRRTTRTSSARPNSCRASSSRRSTRRCG